MLQREEARDACGRRIADVLGELAADSEWRGGSGSSEREGEYQGKFSMAAGSEAIYGALEEYHGGLIHRVGLPRKLKDLRQGMEDENCSRTPRSRSLSPTIRTPPSPRLNGRW
eukprot:764006-Hanusia_phi.AAC.3